MPRKLKCECGECRLCKARERRRKYVVSPNFSKKEYNYKRKKYIPDPPSVPQELRKHNRPVHIGYSTDLLLDKLSDEEVYNMLIVYRNFPNDVYRSSF